jgi:hypothetical protein
METKGDKPMILNKDGLIFPSSPMSDRYVGHIGG